MFKFNNHIYSLGNKTLKILESKTVLSFLLPVAVCLFLNKANAQEAKKYIHDGNIQYAEGNYTAAEKQYSDAINKEMNSPEAIFNLGNAFYKQEKYEEAAEQYKRLSNSGTSKDTLSKAFHNLGNALMQAKKYEDGVDAYKNALKNNPQDEDTRYNLAYAQQMLKKQQEQQQQNKEDNKEKKEDKDKKDDQDKKNEDQKDDQKNEDKDKEEQEKQDQEKDKKEQEEKGEQKPKKDEISKEDAKRLLDALQNDEKNLQDKLKKQKGKGVKVNIEKDW